MGLGRIGGLRLAKIIFLQTLTERVADNDNLLECDVEGTILRCYMATQFFLADHITQPTSLRIGTVQCECKMFATGSRV